MGLVVRLTVTPLESAPAEDSQIAKFAVPPGLTLELPEKTSTLSHSLTGVGAGANTAVSPIAVPGATAALLGAGDAPAGPADVAPGAGAAAAVGVDPAADPDGDPAADGAADGDAVDVVEADADAVGEGDRAGDGDGDFDGVGVGEVGGGLGVTVVVTHGCGAAAAASRGGAPLVLPKVTAVVAMTAPAMHMPVAMPATTDLCLRTLTRLTPFLRSSVEGSLFTQYRHTMC